MSRELKVGMAVRYWDEYRREHDALLTDVHGEIQEIDGNVYIPCVNVVYVSKEEKKRDPHGRQLERDASVVHRNDMHIEGRPARCWDWLD